MEQSGGGSGGVLEREMIASLRETNELQSIELVAARLEVAELRERTEEADEVEAELRKVML